jgi:hypothetical protein
MSSRVTLLCVLTSNVKLDVIYRSSKTHDDGIVAVIIYYYYDIGPILSSIIVNRLTVSAQVSVIYLSLIL